MVGIASAGSGQACSGMIVINDRYNLQALSDLPKSDHHFMVDSRVMARLIEHAKLTTEDVVLKVGAGHGELTSLLARKAGRVIAFELDRAMSETLRSRFRGTGVEVICDDATKAELPVFTKCVSNLPYSISSAFTRCLMELDFELAVLTYQLEFARRLLAGPGDDGYSPISILARFYFNVEIAERVPRTAFRPRPRVDSAVVLLQKRVPSYRVDHPDFFKSFLAAAFLHRRKTLRKSLISTGVISTVPITPDKLHGIPGELLGRRAEELQPEDLAFISGILYQNLH